MTTPWTEKGTRAKCRRKLKSIQRKVTKMAEEIAYDWSDVDQSIVSSCDAMISAVDLHVDEIEAYMTERVQEAQDGDQLRMPM